MAEGVGFEPTNGLPHCWFSRPVLSTAQPPLQIWLYADFNIFFMDYKQPQYYSMLLCRSVAQPQRTY